MTRFSGIFLWVMCNYVLRTKDLNDISSIMKLLQAYPNTRFRLHADVKVVGESLRPICVGLMKKTTTTEMYSQHIKCYQCTLLFITCWEKCLFFGRIVYKT